MNREFSKRPVLVHSGPDGFRHQFFVMYHATNASNVESILANGFRESTGGMLGPGLYVSRDIDKTRNYGDVCFKLLVYTGKTKKATAADTSGSWISQYDSVYLPPNNDVVASKREETCLKSAKQARILGVAYGYDSTTMKDKVRNLEGTTEVLDLQEMQALAAMAFEGAWGLGMYTSSFPSSASFSAPTPTAPPLPPAPPAPPTPCLRAILRKKCTWIALILIGLTLALGLGLGLGRQGKYMMRVRAGCSHVSQLWGFPKRCIVGDQTRPDQN